MEGDPFDQTGKGFAILGGDVGGGHTIHDALSPVKMPCLHGNDWAMEFRHASAPKNTVSIATLNNDDPVQSRYRKEKTWKYC